MDREIKLTELTFENYEDVIKLKPKEEQKEFVEDITTTLAIAHAGQVQKLPGELCVITYEDIPVGVALIGRSDVGDQEPEELRKHGYSYRIIGFFIDEKYQNQGIGRRALELLIQKIESYQDGKKLPISLEVVGENIAAMKLYQEFGFCDSGTRYDKDCAFVRLPKDNSII